VDPASICPSIAVIPILIHVVQAVPKLVAPLERAFSGLTAAEFSMLDKLLRKAIVSFDQSALPLRAAHKPGRVAETALA
jgi:hypothetical protein